MCGSDPFIILYNIPLHFAFDKNKSNFTKTPQSLRKFAILECSSKIMNGDPNNYFIF